MLVSFTKNIPRQEVNTTISILASNATNEGGVENAWVSNGIGHPGGNRTGITVVVSKADSTTCMQNCTSIVLETLNHTTPNLNASNLEAKLGEIEESGAYASVELTFKVNALPGETYPFKLTFPVTTNYSIWQAEQQQTEIEGDFKVEPVVSAQHGRLFACEVDGVLSTQVCTGTESDPAVFHFSAIRFEVSAVDIDGLDIPKALLSTTAPPDVWRCPPIKSSGKVQDLFQKVKATQANAPTKASACQDLPARDCVLMQTKFSEDSRERGRSSHIYTGPALPPGNHELWIQTDAEGDAGCKRWSDLEVKCASGYNEEQDKCVESKTGQIIAQVAAGSIVLMTGGPLIYLLRTNPGKAKAVLKAFITGPFMVAFGLASEVLDAVGDHYFYKDVFGAFMWGSEPAENAADTRQVKQARLDLKSPWNAFLVLASIICLFAGMCMEMLVPFGQVLLVQQ